MTEVVLVITRTTTGYEVRMPVPIFLAGLAVLVGIIAIGTWCSGKARANADREGK